VVRVVIPHLNQLGFDVLGADLSENSIAEASKHKMTPCILKFMTCECLLKKSTMLYLIFYQLYFENEEDNLTTLIAIKESLSEYGFAVIDFLNVSQVLKHLFRKKLKRWKN
jgi:hypothetical protein